MKITLETEMSHSIFGCTDRSGAFVLSTLLPERKFRRTATDTMRTFYEMKNKLNEMDEALRQKMILILKAQLQQSEVLTHNRIQRKVERK
jgi:hypothetical protein